MGISRDSRHKKRLTGGAVSIHQKKRAFEKGRPSAQTKIGDKRIKKIRVRGGNSKFRALRLNTGNFIWQSEGFVAKTKINSVAYHPSDLELVRTNTLVKRSIIRIDSQPFKNYIVKHYFGVQENEAQKNSTVDINNWASDAKATDKLSKLRQRNPMDPKVLEQINKGIVLACVTSRPGQSGRCDGYLLEGKELEFYQKKISKK